MPCKYNSYGMPLEGTIWQPPLEKKMLYGPTSRFNLQIIVRDASLLPDNLVGLAQPPIVQTFETLEQAKAWCDRQEPQGRSYEEFPPDTRLKREHHES